MFLIDKQGNQKEVNLRELLKYNPFQMDDHFCLINTGSVGADETFHGIYFSTPQEEKITWGRNVSYRAVSPDNQDQPIPWRGIGLAIYDSSEEDHNFHSTEIVIRNSMVFGDKHLNHYPGQSSNPQRDIRVPNFMVFDHETSFAPTLSQRLAVEAVYATHLYIGFEQSLEGRKEHGHELEAMILKAWNPE